MCLSNTTPVCHSEVHVIHDHSLYLVCPGLVVAVGETSHGIRVEFIGSTHSLHYLFIYLFVSLYLWCKIYSYPVKKVKVKQSRYRPGVAQRAPGS
jgi:hypothetical protein